MNKYSSIYDFVGFSEIAETTTHLLSLALQHTKHSPAGTVQVLTSIEQYVLQQARDYLSAVREGFTLGVRATNVREYGEMRFLLDRVLTDWDELSRDLGIEDLTVESGSAAIQSNVSESPTIKGVRSQLLAYGMAVIALGALPRLPSKRVTFPQSYSKPPTYRDIPVPRTPGELLSRIEEMEEMVLQLMSVNLEQLVQRRYGPLRRTYGFFETSAWLSARDVERFGVKKRTQTRGLH